MYILLLFVFLRTNLVVFVFMHLFDLLKKELGLEFEHGSCQEHLNIKKEFVDKIVKIQEHNGNQQFA